jgi:predicted ATP-dependent endonuclease of OLD family
VIFRSLKMAGFKSFAESAEVEIDSGLTGIVGPNGCGKSNIVEGLRWVMGESSARQMRGGEMDDVIFGGTEQRPRAILPKSPFSLITVIAKPLPNSMMLMNWKSPAKLNAAKAAAIM